MSDDVKYEFTKVEISKDYKEGDIDLNWGEKHIGFGHLAFLEKDGKIYCNNECMSRPFLKAVLCELVDRAIMNDSLQAQAGESHE